MCNMHYDVIGKAETSKEDLEYIFTMVNTNVTQFVGEWLLFLFVFHIKSPLFNCDPDAEKTTSPASWGEASSRAVTGRPAASSRGQCSAVQGGEQVPTLHCYTALHTRYTPHYTHSDQWLATVGIITSPLVLAISRLLLTKDWALRSQIIKQ